MHFKLIKFSSSLYIYQTYKNKFDKFTLCIHKYIHKKNNIIVRTFKLTVYTQTLHRYTDCITNFVMQSVRCEVLVYEFDFNTLFVYTHTYILLLIVRSSAYLQRNVHQQIFLYLFFHFFIYTNSRTAAAYSMKRYHVTIT